MTKSWTRGQSVSLACESAVLREARSRRFIIAYTINTSEVTKFIAHEHLGMRQRVALRTIPVLKSKGVSPKQETRLRMEVPESHEVVLSEILLAPALRLDGPNGSVRIVTRRLRRRWTH